VVEVNTVGNAVSRDCEEPENDLRVVAVGWVLPASAQQSVFRKQRAQTIKRVLVRCNRGLQHRGWGTRSTNSKRAMEPVRKVETATSTLNHA